MSAVVVTGTQWGDEGKGKIVDYLAEKADTVVRYQGGSNAGHTVSVKGEEFKLRLLPSGILYHGKTNVVGNGVIFDPEVALEEMNAMQKRGIDTSGIRISNRAHVVLPYHRIILVLILRRISKALRTLLCRPLKLYQILLSLTRKRLYSMR